MLTSSLTSLINANLDKHGEASFDTYYKHPGVGELREAYPRPDYAVFETVAGQIIIKKV